MNKNNILNAGLFKARNIGSTNSNRRHGFRCAIILIGGRILKVALNGIVLNIAPTIFDR